MKNCINCKKKCKRKEDLFCPICREAYLMGHKDALSVLAQHYKSMKPGFEAIGQRLNVIIPLKG